MLFWPLEVDLGIPASEPTNEDLEERHDLARVFTVGPARIDHERLAQFREELKRSLWVVIRMLEEVLRLVQCLPIDLARELRIPPLHPHRRAIAMLVDSV